MLFFDYFSRVTHVSFNSQPKGSMWGVGGKRLGVMDYLDYVDGLMSAPMCQNLSDCTP